MEVLIIIVLVLALVTLWAVLRNINDRNSAFRVMQDGTENTLSVPRQESGIPEEVVAAISAAVCCMYPGAEVKQIRRSAVKPQSAWKLAGLLENTRPF